MSNYPTLRYGDESADGWVEYLQELLSVFVNEGIEKTGRFDDATLHAVKRAQAALGLDYMDGVVGDETWAGLRGEEHTDPGTDGREAHTFVDEGQHVISTREPGITLRPESGGYQLLVPLVNTGTTTISDQGLNGEGSTEMVWAQGQWIDGAGDIKFCNLALFYGENLDQQQAALGESLFFMGEVRDDYTPGTQQLSCQLPESIGGQHVQGEFEIAGAVA
ncbi:MAG: peptidoglycan-binding protein [Acidimicrobiia bacterium]|nr:peptidoglycan-binding protein [Acidimicrobiia bacterium]